MGRERQINKMREIHTRFPESLKMVLSKVRIIEHANLTLIPKAERKQILKDLNELRTQQRTIINFEVELSKKEKNVIKTTYQAFCLEGDVLAIDLRNVNLLIEETRNGIKEIKADYDEYNRAKRKESNKKMAALKARQTMYHIAFEVIQHKHDIVRSDSKYGYEAIKIRRQIEKKQKGTIKKIDNRIDKLMQVLYSY